MPNNSYLDINLVKKNLSFTDKFLGWALSAGRAIIILTEIIALSAFAYRFILDRQIIDLHAKIKQQQAIIAFSKANEDKYRNLQERLTIADRFSKLGQQEVTILKDVLDIIPTTGFLNNIIASDSNIKISAGFSQISELGSFVDSLKKYPSISSVNIDKIENISSSSIISVTLTASLKPNPNSNIDEPKKK